MKIFKLSTLLALLIANHSAWSDPIFYEAENLGGDTWEYKYTVGNDTGVAFDWFSIFFDPADYTFDFDAAISGPDGWDFLAIPPELLFPGPEDDQAGIFDVCGFFDVDICFGDDVFVLPGELVGSFTIVFDWLGSPGTTPGSQPFTLFGDDLPVGPDGQTDLTNHTLFTQPLVSVPEPGTIVLLGVGITLFGLFRRRQRAGTENFAIR